MLISKHGDPIIGVDIHLLTYPPAPAPVPVPHPHIGLVFDPVDYIPIIGSTVSINGIPRSQAGTAGKAIPHIPMGGVWVPPPPMNEEEIFMGSLNVVANGAPLTFSNLPVLTCQSVGIAAPIRAKKPKKSFGMVLPTSMVTAIPGGMPVMVGGIGAVPTVDMMAIAMRGAFAAIAPLAKAAKRAKGGKLANKWKQLATRFNKKVGAAMDKVGLSKFRNKVQDSVCSVTGHPINVATGQLFTNAVDLELPGPVPFEFNRVWRSTSKHNGELGCGWHHSYDYRLYIVDDVALVQLADGRIAEFRTPTLRLPSLNRQEKLYLKVKDGRFYLEDYQSNYKVFGEPQDEKGTRFLLWEADPHGNRIYFERDGACLKRIKDSCGRILRIQTDQYSRITEIFGPDPTVANEEVSLVKYQYNESGDLIEVRDAHKEPFRYIYENHLLVREIDRENFSFYFEFDKNWQSSGDHTQAYCVKTWGDGNLFYRELRYDLENQYTKSVDSKGGVTHYYWNDIGVVVNEINPVGGKSQTTFDELANKLSEVDGRGNETKYTYDSFSQLLSLEDPEGNTTHLEYDRFHNVTKLTNAKGDSWQFEYDRNHQLTKKALPNHQVIDYSYNLQGLLVQTSQAGNKQEFVWRQGMLSQVIHENNIRQDFSYDYLGRNIRLQDYDKRILHFKYDLLHQLVAKTNREGGKEYYSYNKRGQLSHYTDALHRTTHYNYRYIALVNKTFTNGYQRQYDYDTELNLIKLTNENNDCCAFKYDQHERLVEEIAFDGRRQKYEYDEIDCLTRYFDGDSRVIDYVRDHTGNALKKICSDGDISEFQYDELGRLLVAKNNHSEVGFEYDCVSNIVRERQDSKEIQHSYNSGDGSVNTQLPNGGTIDYHFNKLGDLENINYNGESIAQFQNDSLGREVKRQLGSVSQNFEYDVMGRLKSFNVQRNSNNIIARGYEYDAVGNIRHISDLKNSSTTIVYDPLDRVLNTSSRSPEKFIYDPAGNLVDDNPAEKFGYSQGNRLRFYQDKHFEYDEVGNLVRERFGKKQCREKHFVFNHQNQMVAAEVEGQTFTYKYDALGRRISKSDRFGETHFIWNGDVLLGEKRKHSEKIYISKLDSHRPLCQIENGNIHYYHLDISGAPRELTDANGEIVWNASYKVYGKASVNSRTSVENNLRFQGQYYDAETGLHYNRFRYYHPDMGRYISQDPIGLLGGEHLFEYTANPFRFIDPLGLAKKDNYNNGWKSISEPENFEKNISNSFGKGALKKIDDIKERLATGKAGGNVHTLGNRGGANLAGCKAIEIPNTGKGRGAGRIVFKETDDYIEIVGVVKGHDYKNLLDD